MFGPSIELSRATKRHQLESILRAALWALRKAQEIIGIHTVILSLDVFVTRCTGGDDDPYRLPASVYPEAPLAGLNPFNCFFLRNLPASLVCIQSADELNTLMWTLAITLVDAKHLMV